MLHQARRQPTESPNKVCCLIGQRPGLNLQPTLVPISCVLGPCFRNHNRVQVEAECRAVVRRCGGATLDFERRESRACAFHAVCACRQTTQRLATPLATVHPPSLRECQSAQDVTPSSAQHALPSISRLKSTVSAPGTALRSRSTRQFRYRIGTRYGIEML